jgi:hypothetical protein
MYYTIVAYHNDDTVSKLVVAASSSTEALMFACQHYLENGQYLAPVVKIMLEVEDEYAVERYLVQ